MPSLVAVLESCVSPDLEFMTVSCSVLPYFSTPELPACAHVIVSGLGRLRIAAAVFAIVKGA